MDLGSTVTLVYTGKLEDGTVFGYATEENPMVFQTGMDMAIDGFEKEILAMEGVEGEKKTFTVDQYEAYGEYLDDYVVVIPTHQIPKRDIKVGSRLWMANDEGEPTLGTVIEIEGGNAKFDLNHPLAGKDLTFEVEIKSVEAAPENFISEHEKRQHMKEQSKLLGGDQGESYRITEAAHSYPSEAGGPRSSMRGPPRVLEELRRASLRRKKSRCSLCSGFRMLGECRGAYSVTKFSGNCLFAFSTSLLVSP